MLLNKQTSKQVTPFIQQLWATENAKPHTIINLQNKELSFWVIYKGSLYHSIHLSINILLWMHVHFWQTAMTLMPSRKLKEVSQLKSIKAQSDEVLVFKIHCSSVLTRHTLSFITYLFESAVLRQNRRSNSGFLKDLSHI